MGAASYRYTLFYGLPVSWLEWEVVITTARGGCLRSGRRLRGWLLETSHRLLLETTRGLLLEASHGLLLEAACGLLLKATHRLLLETAHRLLVSTHGLRVVWADAPCVQAVEEDHATLGVGPFPALKVKVDNDFLANLVLVYYVGARVGQLEQHVL